MTKKFLAALIALSMVGVYACDSDDDSDSCTTGAYKCDGTKATLCVNGAWSTAVDCATSGMVCDATVGCKKAGGATCDATAIATCTAAGGSMDANCQCQTGGQPQTGCTDAQKTACTTAGGTLDASCQCKTGGTPTQDVPTSCTKGTSPAVCGQDGNAYFCGDDGYYLGKTCDAANPCYVCDNGYGGCGDKATSCKSGGGDKEVPSDIPTSCTKGTSPAVCGQDGNAYFCGNDGYYLGKTCDVSNPCYVCDNGYGGCGDKATSCKSGGGSDELCTASSTSGCKKNCATDKSVGYYWSGKELVTVTCPSNDCIIDSKNHVVCESGSSSSGGDLPADVPTSCTKGTSGAFCASDGNAYFCGNDGYYFGKKCDTSNPCYVCDNGYGGCGDKTTECKSGGGEDSGEACVYGTDEPKCVGQDLMICGDQNKFYKKETCSTDKPCTVSNGWGSCGATDNCTLGQFESSCGADGNTSTYCSTSGKVSTKACGDKQCVKCTDGYVGCGADCSQDDHNVACTGEKRTQDGSVGDCCDPIAYKAVCNGTASITYCSSVGKVKTKDCGSECSVTSNTNYVCK